MKHILLILVLFPISMLGQGVRVDIPLSTSGPNVPTSGGGLPQPTLLANSTVSICVHPAPSLSSCTPVPTYTDMTLAKQCPVNTPIVQLPGSACVTTTGSRGNVGFWYAGGKVDYWVKSSYGTSGPYTTPEENMKPVGPSGPTGQAGPPGAGNIVASPQSTMLFQSPPGTVLAAHGDPSTTTDGAGHMQDITTASSADTVIDVKKYNAKCDGVTDDQTAIQAAFNAALTKGYSVQFPAGHCLTSTIVYKGQSFFGAGKGITFIQGQPGQDVFQSPDNNSYKILSGATIHDLNIVVNTSVNAAATAGGGNNTFPNRIAGTVQNLTPFTIPIVPGNTLFGVGNCTGQGASATASTTSVSIVCPGALGYAVGLLDPALVIGAPITINGAGPAGGVYTGTITAVASGCRGAPACTLAVTPAISTTVKNAAGSMLNAQTPPWYIGNAGIALQCSNGSNCSGSASSWNLYNVEFDQSQTTYLTQNHSAGFFTQNPMYACHFEKLFFLHLYAGYVEASPITGAIGTGDTSSFKDIDFFQGVIPMVTINGNDRDLSNINFYAEYPLQAGPYYLVVKPSAALGWTIHGIYLEGSYEQSGEFARFMAGLGAFHVTGANIFGGASRTPLGWVEWNTTAGYVDGLLGNAIKVDGNLNDFRDINLPPSQIIDNGHGNVFSGLIQSGSNNYQGRRYNPSRIPTQDSLGKLDGSFLLSGNSETPYFNASDLLTTCSDWTFTYNPSLAGAQGTCVSDPTGTEITHRYYQSPTATFTFDMLAGGTAYTNAWAGAARTFGVSNTIANGGVSSPVPRTKVMVVVQARCVGAATCTAEGHVNDITSKVNIANSGTLAFNSTWTVQSFAADLSNTTEGNVLGYRFDRWSNAGTNYQIAWIGIQPVNNDEHTWLAKNGLPAIPAAGITSVPSWLQSYGDGSEGALNCTSGTCALIQAGEHWYSTCSVSGGAIQPVLATSLGGAPTIIRCSTSATIAGTISYSNNTGGSTGINGNGNDGGGGGGGGFGAANGTAGGGYSGSQGGGAAGRAGVAGGAGSASPASLQKLFMSLGFPYVNTFQCGGSMGGNGGSSGGAGGRGGGCIVIIAPTFSFTGKCDVSGLAGVAGGANTGGGGGGGGGVCLFRSPSMTNSGTFVLTGGAGGRAGTGTSTAGGAGAAGWSKVFTQ